MTVLCVALSLLPLFSLAAGGGCARERPMRAEAVVLGIRSGRGGALSTVFVDRDGFHPVGDGIYVPRQDGWWQLRMVLEGDGRSRFRLAPVASPARRWRDGPRPPARWEGLSPCQRAGRCNELTEARVLFVGPRFLSLHWSAGRYAGARRGRGSAWIDTRTLDGLATGEAALRIGAALGKDAAADYRAAEKAAGPAATAPRKSGTRTWGLVRRAGRWTVRGTLRSRKPGGRRELRDFDVDLAVPATWSGARASPGAWARARHRYRDATDVVVSPSGRTVVVLLPAAIVLENDGLVAGRLSTGAPAIVMAEWALGNSNVARWRSELGSLARRRPTPSGPCVRNPAADARSRLAAVLDRPSANPLPLRRGSIGDLDADGSEDWEFASPSLMGASGNNTHEIYFSDDNCPRYAGEVNGVEVEVLPSTHHGARDIWSFWATGCAGAEGSVTLARYDGRKYAGTVIECPCPTADVDLPAACGKR